MRELAADDDDLVLPDGGLIVRRVADAPRLPEPALGGPTLGVGGIVVARRPPQSSETLPLKDKNATALLPGSDYGPGDTRSSGSAGQKNSEVAADAVKLVQMTQPVVTPSEPAVTCITALLDSFREQQDIRDVLQMLLTDSLLCLGRLRSAVAMAPHDGSKSEIKEVDWVSVSTLVNCWWPIWEAPNE